jgi:hypothetical protein
MAQPPKLQLGRFYHFGFVAEIKQIVRHCLAHPTRQSGRHAKLHLQQILKVLSQFRQESEVEPDLLAKTFQRLSVNLTQRFLVQNLALRLKRKIRLLQF